MLFTGRVGKTVPEVWDKNHLAVACVTVTGTKQKTRSNLVPSSALTSNCEMFIAWSSFFGTVI